MPTMPFRHSAAASSSSQPSYSSPASRMRSFDSPDQRSISDSTVGGPKDMGSAGEVNVITALVGRIVNKLPCNSGMRLASVEADSGVAKSVEALLRLATVRLGAVVQAMVAALESLSKFSSAISLEETGLQTLHSQIFLLHLLNECLSTSWRLQSSLHTPLPGPLPQLWPDPVPLDETLARYLLLTTFTYVRMVSSDPTASSRTSSPAPSRDRRHTLSSDSSTSKRTARVSAREPITQEFLARHSYPSTRGSSSEFRNLRSRADQAPNVESAAYLISQLSAQILFFLSASNWSLIRARLHSRISFLTTTIEEMSELLEMRVLEWSNINSARLSQALLEISTVFLHIKKRAQVKIATSLRRAIFQWMVAYPAEYQSMVESERKLDGGPDMLFDFLWSASDLSSASSASRTKEFYPLMAMLLVLCPDILKKIALGESGRGAAGLSKKTAYLDSLRKGLDSSKSKEICAACYVDFVRASALLDPRMESSGLRSLVSDIETDLKNVLVPTPFLDEPTDMDLKVDGLVALHRRTLGGILTDSWIRLWTTSRENSRVIALRACAVIADDGARFPWYASIEQFRLQMQPYITTTFKNHGAIMIKEATRSRAPRTSLTPDTTVTDVMGEILDLYAREPKFALPQPSRTDGTADLLNLLARLAGPPIVEHIRTAAARAIVSILDVLTTETAAMDKEIGSSVWKLIFETSRPGIYAFAAGAWTDVEYACDAFRAVVAAVHRFGLAHSDLLADDPASEPAIAMGIVLLLKTLTLMDIESGGILLVSFAQFSDLVALACRSTIRTGGAAGEAVQGRIAWIRSISEVGEFVGKVQQQRAVRRITASAARPTTSAVASWLFAAFASRQIIAKHIAAVGAAQGRRTETGRRRTGLAADIEGVSEDEAKRWKLLFLLVCACLNAVNYEGASPPSLVQLVGADALPAAYANMSDPQVVLDAWLKEALDLFTSDSLFIRETVKEGLGGEVPISWGPTLVRHLSRSLSHTLAMAALSPSGQVATFTDQAVSTLRLLVDRIPTGLSDSPAPLAMDELLIKLGQSIHTLSNDEQALRIKARFCGLCENVMRKAQMISLGADEGANTRNQLVEWLLSWQEQAWRDAIQGNTSSDLELACLKALEPLTVGLGLQSAQQQVEEAPEKVLSRLFLRHSGVLTSTLVRGRQSSSNRRGVTNAEDRSRLATSIMTNLLSANMSIGLKHSLALGYHEDPTMRVACTRMMTEVLRSGAELDGTQSNRAAAAPPRPYLDMLQPANLALAVAVVECCPAAEVDEVSQMLFRVTEENGALLPLMRVLIDREVALTNYESELFRANSMTTRLLTIFARSYGYNYLRSTLVPFLQALSERPPECSFELDPSKAGPNDDIERNAEDLKLMCQALIDLICSSMPQVPVLFRAICHHVWETVDSRFPDSRHSSVGSFIFLRFLCPAIVSPESVDLELPAGSKENRRGLLLITKIIQNLANNVVFGNKEPHMKILNGFLSENIRGVTKFLSDLALRPRSADVAAAVKRFQAVSVTLQDPEADGALLHRFVYAHQAKLEGSLRVMPVSFGPADATKRSKSVGLDGRSALQTLQDVIGATGPLSETIRLSAAARLQAFTEFKKQYAGKSSEAVQQAFYEGPASQNGRRIFYLIVRREALVDADLLAHHIYSTLDRISEPFDLVIDLTEFSPKAEPRIGWLRRIVQILPVNVSQHLHTTALYNPNTYSRRRLRRIFSELLPLVGPMGRNLVAVCSPSELAGVIPFSRLALPESTLALAYEADKTFEQVHWLFDREQRVQCIAKLGHDRFQVATWVQQEITPGLKAYIIDVISLQSIDDIVNESTDRLVIKYGKDHALTLVSQDRAIIAQALRAAKSQLPANASGNRSLRTSDVPGTLLYLALLGLSSHDFALRATSFQLVDELRNTLKCEIAANVLPVSGSGSMSGVAFFTFVTQLSAAFAQAVPQATLEFLKEWSIGFNKVADAQKTASLLFVSPWLANLDMFAAPNEKGVDHMRDVRDIVRNLINLTAAEKSGFAPALHEHVWAVLSGVQSALGEIVHSELINTAIDAGFGSDKAECVGEILFAIAGTSARGRVISKLRKTLAQTYLKPSNTLSENAAWAEILVLAKLNLILCIRPDAIIDIQLFLPEILHVVTLLLGSQSVDMRRITHDTLTHVVQALALAPTSGDTDSQALHELGNRLREAKVLALFGLKASSDSDELLLLLGGPEHKLLDDVESVAHLGGELIAAAAPTMDCANAWRARWMGRVAATCFQHNPATQPQAFSVMGSLAADEVDDDLLYQILVALSSTLSHFSESSPIMAVAIVRCLARIIPGLLPDSRYTGSLFWLAVGLCQMGYLPLFPAALDLMLQSLKAVRGSISPGQDLWDTLLEARSSAGEVVTKLDTTSGVSFDIDPRFSLVAVIFRGVRHASTRTVTIDVLQELLRTAVAPGSAVNGETAVKSGISEKGTAFFIALLGASAGSEAETTDLWQNIGIRGGRKGGVMEFLSIPDNSTGLMLITLVVSMLNSAGDDAERLELYRFLVDAGTEMPEVLAMSYDALIPRMTATLSTTAHPGVLDAITTILERAMLDSTYTFPAQLPRTDSQSSLAPSHSYSQSLAQAHGFTGAGYEPSTGSGSVRTGAGQRDQVLEEMGMKGLTELSWSVPKMDRVSALARWVAALIESFTI